MLNNKSYNKNFYQEELFRIKNNYIPKEELIQQIVQAKNFMDKHYEEKLKLDKIAKEANFSKFHFIRAFKSVYGRTPHQYLITIRIQKAKTLLEKGFKVTEVCFLVGFDSVSTFTSLFRKSTGLNPSSFQKRAIFKK